MSGDLAVQCSKLPEWLLARRVIPEDYARLLPGVGAKASEASEQPISDESAKALISEHKDSVDYFAAKAIYEAVSKSPEGQQKSLLGAHSHPGAAKWKAVLDAYQGRKHLGWASGARTLIQNVSYEIPALKEQATACERQVAECTQRQADLTRQEANAKNRYEALLKELGIEGFDVRRELISHANAELPKIYAELMSTLAGSGEEIAAYYQAFAEFASGKSDGDVLPLLRAVARGGEGLTVEEAERALPALKAARAEAAKKPRRAVADGAPAAAAAVEETTSASGGVDWGLSLESSGDAGSGGGGGISWDFEVTAEAPVSAEPAAVDASAAGGGIDWGGISFEGIEMSCEAGDDSAEAKESVLDDPSVREVLYQEVAEAASFLRERLSELSAGLQDTGPKGEDKSKQHLEELCKVTSRAEELLAGRQSQRLLLLRTSERYLEQNVRKVDLAKAQCGKPPVQRAALEKVKAEASQEAKRTRAEMDKLREATRKAQKELEAELSAHFKSTVRIVGEIAQI